MPRMLESGVPQPAKRGTPGDFFRTSVFSFCRRLVGLGFSNSSIHSTELRVGTKKTGKGRRKLGRKKRRMRSKIRHRKK
jgi:hypothetical protein